jgi:hypothetical protein
MFLNMAFSGHTFSANVEGAGSSSSSSSSGADVLCFWHRGISYSNLGLLHHFFNMQQKCAIKAISYFSELFISIINFEI